MTCRTDLPPELVAKAAAVDTALLRWLEAAYPTDEERERQHTRNRRQLVLPIAHRSPR